MLRRFCVGRIWTGAIGAGAAMLLAGCSSSSLSTDAGWFSRPAGLFENQSWGQTTLTQKAAMQKGPVQPEDLIDGSGYCAGMAPDPAALAAATPDGPADPAAPPPLQGGIALEMTECGVAQRAGRPDRVEIGGEGPGQRKVTLTYAQGPFPGIYHFIDGRLRVVERAPEPPPSAKPVKKKPQAKKKKPANPA